MQTAVPLVDKGETKSYYCSSCKGTWTEDKTQKKIKEESLSMGSVQEVGKLVELVSNTLQLSTEIKATFSAQFTSLCLDNWYEGFKAGLMAQIVGEKEKEKSHEYGKNGHEFGTSDPERGDGDRYSGKQDGEDGLGVASVRTPSASASRVKEEITGVTFIRASTDTVSEDKYARIAELIQQSGGPRFIESVELVHGNLIFTYRQGIL